jgi:phosphoserine aminotransferase
MTSRKKADYIDTGIWSKKAIDEAKRYGTVNVAASSSARHQLMQIPEQSSWNLQSDADYVHYTPNETIDGLEFNWVPETGDIPLVADMSSMILSRPIDVTKYGLIYAGAQKNMGQAGVTIVIIRDDLIRDSVFLTPTLYSYKLHAEHQSFYNTPPTYSWYIAGLVFDWLKRHGGVDAMYKVNQRKAKKLYSFIDSHGEFYFSSVHPNNRSLMNVVFSLKDESLNDTFLKDAASKGLTNLRGHRIVGGMRASIYNAMPEEGVDALIAFMQDFANKHA